MNNVYHFDGTMMMRACTLKLKKTGDTYNALCFQQTNKHRKINKEVSEIQMNPDLYFFFHSKESINALIKICENLKKNFDKSKF